MSTATATMPPAMTASMDSLARRDPTPPAATRSAPPWQDWLFERTTMFFALFVLFTLVGIIGALCLRGDSGVRKIRPRVFLHQRLGSGEAQLRRAGADLRHVVTSAIALLIGVPVSFGIALFLTEMCPAVLKRPLGTAVELLAAIPSIIYGMWGLFVFAPVFGDYVQPVLTRLFGDLWILGPLFQGAPNGIGVLSAGIILSVMVIPFIASVMRDVFEIVPPVLKESAYGSAPRRGKWSGTSCCPTRKVGVIGGIMLGLGRALGETMAVTFVIGNAYRISASLFAPGNSIASALANEFNEAAEPVHRAALIELGLVLFVLTFIVLACSRLLLAQLAKREGKST